jgi:hypothetical protein
MIALCEPPTAINEQYESRSEIDENRIIILNNNCCDQIDDTRTVFFSCCYMVGPKVSSAAVCMEIYIVCKLNGSVTS